MSSGWQIRVGDAADAESLVNLYARCHGRSTTPEHWRWKLLCVESRFPTAFLAIHDGRVVGHYGGFPLRLERAGVAAPAVMAVDAMVDPDMRRAGVFSGLMRAAHESWAEAGAVMILGLPNERWGSRARAFDWEYLFPLRWLVRPLRPAKLLTSRLRRLSSSAAGLRHRQQAPAATDSREREPLPAAAIERAAQALAADGRLSIVRDCAWVEWRFGSCPDHDYRVVARPDRNAPAAPCYGVYRMPVPGGAGGALIADVAGSDRSRAAQRRLIRTMLRRLRHAGADSAAALAVPGTPAYRDFVRCGFVPRSTAFDVRAVVLDSSFDLDELRSPRRWTFAGGDFDVV